MQDTFPNWRTTVLMSLSLLLAALKVYTGSDVSWLWVAAPLWLPFTLFSLLLFLSAVSLGAIQVLRWLHVIPRYYDGDMTVTEKTLVRLEIDGDFEDDIKGKILELSERPAGFCWADIHKELVRGGNDLHVIAMLMHLLSEGELERRLDTADQDTRFFRSRQSK